jgi:predicted nucleic acid-binding protein
MKHLLDTNVLLAALISTHPHHAKAFAWLAGRHIVLCPTTELGFLRIGCHKKAYALPLPGLRQTLSRFASQRKADWIADDLPALDSKTARNAEDITDHYLAELAVKHGLKLATFDRRIRHAAVEIIA